jgi:hypothetical protein
MKTLSNFTRLAVCSGILMGATGLRAVTSATPQTLSVAAPTTYQLETVVFGDSAEAGMLHRAYRILATGDHDYKGHRAKAMHAVESAAKLLGLDLKGDYKEHEVQVLSDDKLREARGLLQNVLLNAEVKGQPHISKHINKAIEEINAGLEAR